MFQSECLEEPWFVVEVILVCLLLCDDLRVRVAKCDMGCDDERSCDEEVRRACFDPGFNVRRHKYQCGEGDDVAQEDERQVGADWNSCFSERNGVRLEEEEVS